MKYALQSLLVFLSLYVSDPIQFTLEPPPERLIPEAHTEALPHPAQELPRDETAVTPPEKPSVHQWNGFLQDSRPLVYFYTMPNCKPCQAVKDDILSGKLWMLKIEMREAPGWVTTAPAFHYQDVKGDWRIKYGYSGTEDLTHAMLLSVAKGPRTGQATAPLGATPSDQFQKFLGQSGSVSVNPDKPINTTLDDGTIVQYSSITAKYRMVNGQPALYLNGKLPHVITRVGIGFIKPRIGADIDYFEYLPPTSLKVGTNRGNVVIKLEAAK